MENGNPVFQKTGIHQFNKNMFTEDLFLTLFVTERHAVVLHNGEISAHHAPGTSADIPLNGCDILFLSFKPDCHCRLILNRKTFFHD